MGNWLEQKLILFGERNSSYQKDKDLNNSYQKDKDLVFIRRASDNKEFEEYPLIVQPQSLLALSPQNNLYCMPINSIPMSSASFSISSSYSLTASFALNGGGSGSGSGFTLTTGSTYPITSSWAISASWAPFTDNPNAVSASYALTASYALNGGSGGSTLSSSWASSSLSSSYTSMYPDITDNTITHVVEVTGDVQIDGWLKTGGYNRNVYSSDVIQIGYFLNKNNITDNAVQIGSNAGYNSTTASNAVQLGVAAGEFSTNAAGAVQIGSLAGYATTNATNSVQIGAVAGGQCPTAPGAVQIGAMAGYNATDATNAVMLGSGADALNTSPVQKSIALGYNAKVTGNNQCVIGGTGADAVKVSIGGNSAVNTLDVVGNISCSVITASLFNGTASYARTSSYAVSASWSPAVGGGSSASSSWASQSVSASYATTASYALNSSVTLTTGATYNITSSWASSSISSSYSLSSSYALTASYSRNQLPDITDDISNHFIGIDNPSPKASLDVMGNILLSGYLINTGSAPADSNFVGYRAGFYATTAINSNFFGKYAGYAFYGGGAQDSNFFGNSAGLEAVSAHNSNFFGFSAGYNATNAVNSNFFGYYAGYGSINAHDSNFFGYYAGAISAQTGNASYSNFFGYQAGNNAFNANNSIFIGYNSGNGDTVNNSAGNSSILIGDYTSTGGNFDSIAIGKGTMNSAIKQLNIGNVIYATGIYSGSTPSSTPIVGGKVGIRINNPVNTFDVGGNISCSVITASLFYGTASYALNGGGASLTTGATYPITASWAISASWASASLSSSYATTASYALNGGSGGGVSSAVVWARTTPFFYQQSAADFGNLLDYTSSVNYIIPANGMYRLNVVANGFETGSNQYGGNRTIYFGAKFTDEQGAYLVYDLDTVIHAYSPGLTTFGPVTPPEYYRGEFRYYFSYLFSAVAGQTFEYYWTDNGNPLGYVGNSYTCSITTKASIEKLLEDGVDIG